MSSVWNTGRQVPPSPAGSMSYNQPILISNMQNLDIEDDESEEDSLPPNDEGDGGILDGDRKKKNREAAKRMRQKSQQKTEDVKKDFLALSSEQVQLKYQLQKIKQEYLKLIEFAETHKKHCPGFTYQLKKITPELSELADIPISRNGTPIIANSAGSNSSNRNSSIAQPLHQANQPTELIKKLSRKRQSTDAANSEPVQHSASFVPRSCSDPKMVKRLRKIIATQIANNSNTASGSPQSSHSTVRSDDNFPIVYTTNEMTPHCSNLPAQRNLIYHQTSESPAHNPAPQAIYSEQNMEPVRRLRFRNTSMSDMNQTAPSPIPPTSMPGHGFVLPNVTIDRTPDSTVSSTYKPVDNMYNMDVTQPLNPSGNLEHDTAWTNVNQFDNNGSRNAAHLPTNMNPQTQVNVADSTSSDINQPETESSLVTLLKTILSKGQAPVGTSASTPVTPGTTTDVSETYTGYVDTFANAQGHVSQHVTPAIYTTPSICTQPMPFQPPPQNMVIVQRSSTGDETLPPPSTPMSHTSSIPNWEAIDDNLGSAEPPTEDQLAIVHLDSINNSYSNMSSDADTKKAAVNRIKAQLLEGTTGSVMQPQKYIPDMTYDTEPRSSLICQNFEPLTLDNTAQPYQWPMISTWDNHNQMDGSIGQIISDGIQTSIH